MLVRRGTRQVKAQYNTPSFAFPDCHTLPTRDFFFYWRQLCDMRIIISYWYSKTTPNAQLLLRCTCFSIDRLLPWFEPNCKLSKRRESSEKLYDAREGWKKLLSDHCKGYSDQRCVFLTKFFKWSAPCAKRQLFHCCKVVLRLQAIVMVQQLQWNLEFFEFFMVFHASFLDRNLHLLCY